MRNSDFFFLHLINLFFVFVFFYTLLGIHLTFLVKLFCIAYYIIRFYAINVEVEKKDNLNSKHTGTEIISI